MQSLSPSGNTKDYSLPFISKYLPAQSRAWPWIIFLVALSIRTLWAAYSHYRRINLNQLEFPDEEQYWLIATNLVEGIGMCDEIGHRAGRMPVYISFLSLFVHFKNGIILAKLAHLIIGSAIAVATYAFAKRLFSPAVGVVAGLMLALDPFYIFFSTQLLTETPFGLLVTIFYCMLIPWIAQLDRKIETPEWILITILAILMIYVRESTLGLIILLTMFILILHRFERRVLRGTILSFLLLILALVPWALRNKAVTNSWIWLTTRGGISLYDGVGPQATGQSFLNNVKQMPAVINLSEVEYDRYFKTESMKCIREEPGRILNLALKKLSIFWNPFPNAANYDRPLTRFVSGAWTIPTFTLAGIGVILLWRQGGANARIGVYLLLPAIYLTAIHMLFVASIRYRMGAIPMISTLAAYALTTIFSRIHLRRIRSDV